MVFFLPLLFRVSGGQVILVAMFEFFIFFVIFMAPLQPPPNFKYKIFFSDATPPNAASSNNPPVVPLNPNSIVPMSDENPVPCESFVKKRKKQNDPTCSFRMCGLQSCLGKNM